MKLEEMSLNELEKNLVRCLPNAKEKDLELLNEVDEKFENYLNRDSQREYSNSYFGRKFIDFLHEGKRDAYKNQEFKGDYSPHSIVECCKNILSEKEKVGDCIGMSQIGISLLSRRNVPVSTLYRGDHILLNIENKKNIPLETTLPWGFNYHDERDVSQKFHINHIYPFLLQNLGVASFEKQDSSQAIEYFTKAIEIYPDFSPAKYNRGITSLLNGNCNQGMPDLKSAIKTKNKIFKEIINDALKKTCFPRTFRLFIQLIPDWIYEKN